MTELFLNSGHRVLGIEPDPEMRAAAEWLLQGYPRFTSIAATAEATSLADYSIEVVTVGQAFQWFDREQARREFLRILVPQGWVVLVWNRENHRNSFPGGLGAILADVLDPRRIERRSDWARPVYPLATNESWICLESAS